jgi:4-hydroxybenzoate polyprenyltransferase
MANVIQTVGVWGEMVKFSHTVFALPLAVLAAFIAGRDANGPDAPGWSHLLLIVVCMVAARSVAMTFNRIVDESIDAKNPRTANRPIPSGRISRRSSYVFLFMASAVFVIGCYAFQRWFANPWPLYLCVPVLAYLCGYSYTKRFTKWSHFYLGSAIGFSPIGAWIAMDPAGVGWAAVVLSIAVMLWIAGFDLIYACQDVAFDREVGLHSIPAGMGVNHALTLARACHAVVIVLLVALWSVADLGWLYLVGVGCVAVLLTVENAMVRADDLSKVNLAFFAVNGIVSVCLGLLGVMDVLFVSTGHS